MTWRRTIRAGTALAIGVAAGLLAEPLIWPGDSADPAYRTVAEPTHGRGLSQLGAMRNARDGWTAERILGHYYPGATLGSVGPASISVWLTSRDGADLSAFSDMGARVAGRLVKPGQVAHLIPRPNGRADVKVTTGCEGEVIWQTETDDPWIYPLDPSPNRPATEHLTLCGGGSYRGSLGVAESGGAVHTVNRVDVEDYLLGVLPAEVQANWADSGAAEALRAQAIAARSYALAEQRYPFAQTCDTSDCQTYPGTAKEDRRTNVAVDSTTGTVLLREGRILRAEYSSASEDGPPADIRIFEVGPTPAELTIGTPVPGAPRFRVDLGVPVDPNTDPATAEQARHERVELVPNASLPLGSQPGPRPDVSPGQQPGAPAGPPPGAGPGAPAGAEPSAPAASEPNASANRDPGAPGTGSPTDSPGASDTPRRPPTAIETEYARLGGADSVVGKPLGPEMRLPGNRGTYRLFEKGVIIDTPMLGTQVVDFDALMRMVPGMEGTEPGDAGPSQAIPAPRLPEGPADSEAPAGTGPR
ncbi:SpoIID/LytB domain-containing protein [Nocardia paucivorans]|uniref:SpoIID/LytB domain-containing protein n=1 Tax=Nocardia paucivorans TaxID=114259 RepID=UPI0002EE29A6|nr:SpoIID/LytB domain-containing protein [Nocardia paucivorans]